MPLDALCLSAAAEELRNNLIGCRVDKVQQPERDVILLSIRGENGPCRLLISAGSGTARVHLTTMNRENPAEPPMFCMLLRKHLVGARILAVEQPEMERLFLLRFSCLDEMGVASEKKLAVEMMGRNSNLALIDGNGRILDCLRKADALSSPQRPLLPGLYYQLPPSQDKPNLLLCSRERFLALVETAVADDTADNWLVHTFSGVSPVLGRELVARCTGSCDTRLRDIHAERLWDTVEALLSEPSEPVLLSDREMPRELYCRRLVQYGGAWKKKIYPSFSALLDAYFTEKERLARQQQRSQTLTKLVKTRRERAARKLAARTAERQATEKRETWRQWGDILKANLYRMQRGAKELEAEDFYDPEQKIIRIPLDQKLSPQQNAAHYYKLYTKAKNAEKILAEQIVQAETELEYLDSVLEELERSGGERDLLEIRQELIAEGYVNDGEQRRKKASAPQPMCYKSSAGVRIRVGKNNLQNDWLTLKSAEKNSIWLHAQKTHGSHVIADCAEDDRETLAEAAMLAAYYSRGRGSSNVPVDYTRVRYVKKPSGGRPGMVIYTDYKTLFVTPDQDAIARMYREK